MVILIKLFSIEYEVDSSKEPLNHTFSLFLYAKLCNKKYENKNNKNNSDKVKQSCLNKNWQGVLAYQVYWNIYIPQLKLEKKVGEKM